MNGLRRFTGGHYVTSHSKQNANRRKDCYMECLVRMAAKRAGIFLIWTPIPTKKQQ
jgi:hypothetical protein